MRSLSLILGTTALLSLAAVLALSGLAVTGPDQSFTVPQGQYRDSYLRIWNEGDQRAQIRLSAEGPASSFTLISSTTFYLDPGKERVVDLRYQVPIGTATGKYEGVIEARTEGVIVASVQRPISIWVTQAGSPDASNLDLQVGLNLVSWPGDDVTLFQALGSGNGISKVWRRKASGDYVFASYYQGQGWWCSDSSFTHLRRGEAYFIECTSPCQISVDPAAGPMTLDLEKGTNLVGWPGSTMPVDLALPQSSSHHPVTKVWRRNGDGSYSSTQFFPQEETWWSSDSSFTSLENGRAYFVECDQDASFVIPG
jgi:hypothetical protein